MGGGGDFLCREQGCGSGLKKCRFRRFRFQNVVIPPTKWKRLCRAHIPGRTAGYREMGKRYDNMKIRNKIFDMKLCFFLV